MSTISSLRKAIEALEAAELALSGLVATWPEGTRWRAHGEAIYRMYEAAGDDASLLRHVLEQWETAAYLNSFPPKQEEPHGE